ncbi:efflux RND transporter permease subunit [Bacteriovoracales bacterium]|nr:efflux RND transporter permease subunit [Bacteriovoracales bacterium]
MKAILKFFVERQTFAHLLTLFVILAGLYSIISINKDSLPKVDFQRVMIVTAYPGGSSGDVELKITNKIEDKIKSIANINKSFSITQEGISRIVVFIDEDAADKEKVKDEIRRGVDQISDFPADLMNRPTISELNASMFPILEVGITGDIPYEKLRQIVKNFRKKLKDIDGISRIENFGLYAPEIRIEASLEKLIKNDVSILQLHEVLNKRNTRATVGKITKDNREKNIVPYAEFENLKDVGNVIVRSNYEGKRIRIKDLAIVKEDFQKPQIYTNMNGKRAISLIIYKTDVADVINTVDKVKKLISSQKSILPESIQFTLNNDNSRIIRDKFKIVANNGILGLILVNVILSIFLYYRTAFWVALGIPFSLFGSFIYLQSQGMAVDRISLTAMVIVVGIIVDDAIIIAENIYRHFSELKKTPVEAAVDGTAEVFKPVLTTILTTFLAFAPMFFMTGLMGKFISIIPLIITSALFISFFECCFILPSHLVPGLHKLKSKEEGEWFSKFVKKPFISIFGPILKGRYLFVFLFILFFLSSLYYAKNYMQFILFPESVAERVIITTELPKGVSLEKNKKAVSELEKILLQSDRREIISFATRIGLWGDEIKSRLRDNSSVIYVDLSPYGERKRVAREIVEELREKTKKLKEFKKINFNVIAGGPPVGRPVELQIVGANDEIRKKLSLDVVRKLKNIKGVKDIETDDAPGKEEIQLIFNYEKLSRLGLTLPNIVNSLRMSFDGVKATSIRRGDEDIEYKVILDKKDRMDKENIKKLLVPNSIGRLIELGKAIEFKSEKGQGRIKHHNGDRSITITADLDQKITDPVKVTQELVSFFYLDKDYPGTRFIIGGEAEETKKSIKSLMNTFIFATIGIYFLLILLFDSYFQPFYVMLAIPFGIVGVILSFAIHQEALGFMAMLGAIGLAGVVVNDSLVLVSHLNETVKKGEGKKTLNELVVKGTSHRLRPIIITTLTTVAGLIPLAYGLGGSDPFMMPMALSLGYGLIFATPLTIVLVPCFYMIGEDLKGLIWKNKNKS